MADPFTGTTGCVTHKRGPGWARLDGLRLDVIKPAHAQLPLLQFLVGG